MEVLAVLGFVLSVIALGWNLTGWILNQQFARRLRHKDKESDIKARYFEVQPSMEYISGLYWYDQVLAPHGPKWPWAAAYKGILRWKQREETGQQDAFRGTDQQKQCTPDQEADAEQQLQAIAELSKHRNVVDTYWDEVVRLHKMGELPRHFFKKGGGWLKRADNYRQLSEPLFIANFYRVGFDVKGTGANFKETPYLQIVDDQYMKRPDRYRYLEDMWTLCEGSKPTPSTCWAVEYEKQLMNLLQEENLVRGDVKALRKRMKLDLSSVDPNGIQLQVGI